MINALENNEIRLWTMIGEEQKTVSQNYKVKKKIKSMSVNYCVMGDETLLCMAYENQKFLVNQNNGGEIWKLKMS